MRNSINNWIVFLVFAVFASVTFGGNVEYSEKARESFIKFLNENKLAHKLTDPVRISQDKSGVLLIKDPGSFFYQYLVLGPEDKRATDPNVVRQLKIQVPKTCDKAVIVTHGWIDKGADDWPADMAKALREKTKPAEWVCLYFDWQNGAAVANPIDAVKYSRDVAGARMANAFLSLLDDGQNLSHVHLIGHSAGTWAVTTAGQIISGRTGAQVHLTLLDAYLPPKWDSKKLGEIKSDKPAYVEHYYSKDITLKVTQDDLPGAHNVDLTKVDQVIKAHEYPYKWYGATVRGKFRKKDFVVDKSIFTEYEGIEYGFKRSLEFSAEGFEKSLGFEKGNKAVVIPRPKKKKGEFWDIFSWFQK